MKIAHLSLPWNAIPPKNYGGTEVMLDQLITEQVKQGHDVTLFAPADSRTPAKLISFLPCSLREEGVPWDMHLEAYYHHYKSMEYIRQHHFDIVHSHLATTTEMYIFPLSSHLSTPHVMTLHNHFPFDRWQDWSGDADSYYMEWISKVPLVAISKRAYQEVSSYPLNIVGIVHHGISTTLFHPTTQPDSFFVWLGRFVPEKGPHLAIQAAQEAGVPLVLAGIIDPHVKQAARYFETMIQPHLDGKHITYVGAVNTEQKIDLLSRARGLLNPIQWEEPFGMVMIEAMAVGCPVIAFARGAAPEIVHHQVSGFLVHTLQEMVAAIPLISQLDRAAVRTHVEQHFSTLVMAEKYTQIYEQVIANYSPSAN